MKPIDAKKMLLAAMIALLPGITQTQAIVLDTVFVGDAGNTNDTTGYGGVGYTYSIGKYEVSNTQYTAFLNSVAVTDTYNLYNTNMGSNGNTRGITRTGSSGSYSYTVIAGNGNKPVAYISWFDAARFANWMSNGQPTGAQGSTTTEYGAYALNGATSGLFSKSATNPNTGAAPTWWIPSLNEWYKAAYYDPSPSGPAGADNYWNYSTRSDAAPGNVVGSGASQANYFIAGTGYSVTQSTTLNGSQIYLTDGGAYSDSASYYGTFDQGGNLWEWNDAVVGSNRGIRGGSWTSQAGNLISTGANYSEGPGNEYNTVGFRLATSIPEPSAALMVLGAGTLFLLRRRV
ncbi:MAG: SUMF1/EgtB/PvdO family nonheme iron enzyme [Chthoniobacterales bacterium]